MTTILCDKHRFENIEAVLFDKDGTLACVEPYLIALGKARAQRIEALAYEVFPRAAAGIGDDILIAFGQTDRAVDPAGLLAVGSRAENEIAAAAYVAARGLGWVAALSLVRKAFTQGAQSLPEKVGQTPLLFGVATLFEWLKSNGVAIGIVSSDTHSEVTAFITHYELDVDWHCGVEGAALTKTQPGFLSLACRTMDVTPAQVLIIGDSASDMALASQGAAGFIGISGGWSTPPPFEASVISATRLSQLQVLGE
ncbi:MAG: HAD-IA family hydrolase [Cyanobacteria bacterium P01_D01_bin.105]